MILAERAARVAAEAETMAARRFHDIEIERLRLEIARLRRERFGASSERAARIDQLELHLEDLEETAAEAEAASEPEGVAVEGISRRRPARRPLGEHLPRERFVHAGPTACAVSARTSPRRWSGCQRVGG